MYAYLYTFNIHILMYSCIYIYHARTQSHTHKRTHTHTHTHTHAHSPVCIHMTEDCSGGEEGLADGEEVGSASRGHGVKESLRTAFGR